MTRNGKIARLPREVREEVNRRLRDGEPGPKLLAWLNALPAARALLAAEFGGREVSEQNLSEWKQGGYCDWLRHQDELALARELATDAAELKRSSRTVLSDVAAPLVTAKYLRMLQELNSEKPATDWRRLRQLCNDLVALRQGDHSVERLRLEQRQVEVAERTLDLKQASAVEMGLKAMIEQLQGHPDAVQAFNEFHEKVKPFLAKT